jgi:hypothetical protein
VVGYQSGNIQLLWVFLAIEADRLSAMRKLWFCLDKKSVTFFVTTA